MRPLEKQQIVIIGVVVAIVGGFLVLECFPLQKKIRTLRAARLEQSMFSTKTAMNLQQMPILQKHLEDIEQTVDKITLKVPESPDLGPLLRQLASVMNKYKLRKQLIQPGTEQWVNQLCRIPLDVQCNGGLREIYKFFKAIEKLDRIIRIESVRLTSNTTLRGNIALSIQASVYYESVPNSKG